MFLQLHQEVEAIVIGDTASIGLSTLTVKTLSANSNYLKGLKAPKLHPQAPNPDGCPTTFVKAALSLQGSYIKGGEGHAQANRL